MSILHGEGILTRQAQTLNALARLPIFNQTALRLLTVATDSDSARADFDSAFRSDPSLAMDLLTTANSAEFGFRSQVASIGHALSLLGLERARSLACMIAMSFYLRTSIRADVSAFWKHSIVSAALAGHLAEVSSLSAPGPYTAAMLHDIGRLGLQMTSPQDYDTLADLPISAMDEALKIERVLFGMNHCEAGAAMSLAWGFPESMERHVRQHHGHAPPQEDPVTNLVQTACRLADGLGYPEFSVAPGAARSGLEEVLPSQFRKHAACSVERLDAVARTHLAVTNRLQVSSRAG
jgi:putative nucleotidyltransferase with HDIG domain